MNLKRSLRNAAITIIALLLFVYILWCSVLFALQRDFLYHPPNDNFLECPYMDKDDVANFGEARLYTDALGTNKTILMYLHGNAESACEGGMWKDLAHSLNISYAIPEYRGFGGDKGIPQKSTILADMDTIAAAFKGRSVIIVGRSIGNGPATYLAAQLHPKELILISPYDELKTVVSNRFIPGFLLKDNFQPSRYLENYSGHIIIYAGEEDTLIPAWISKKIPSDKFVLVPGAGHNDVAAIAGSEIAQDIRDASSQ